MLFREIMETHFSMLCLILSIHASLCVCVCLSVHVHVHNSLPVTLSPSYFPPAPPTYMYT